MAIGKVQVVNKYKIIRPNNQLTDSDVYIGRGSVFGNPYKISKVCTRDQACDCHADLIRKEWKEAMDGDVSPTILGIIQLAERVKNGECINLVCFCSPKRCHGEFIKQVIDWYVTK